MEPVRRHLRHRDPADRVFDDPGGVIDACRRAWTELVADTARLISPTDFARARPSPETS